MAETIPQARKCDKCGVALGVMGLGADFVVVKDWDTARELSKTPATMLPDSFKRLSILVAPNGIEFLSVKDLEQALAERKKINGA